MSKSAFNGYISFNNLDQIINSAETNVTITGNILTGGITGDINNYARDGYISMIMAKKDFENLFISGLEINGDYSLHCEKVQALGDNEKITTADLTFNLNANKINIGPEPLNLLSLLINNKICAAYKTQNITWSLMPSLKWQYIFKVYSDGGDEVWDETNPFNIKPGDIYRMQLKRVYNEIYLIFPYINYEYTYEKNNGTTYYTASIYKVFDMSGFTKLTNTFIFSPSMVDTTKNNISETLFNIQTTQISERYLEIVISSLIGSYKYTLPIVDYVLSNIAIINGNMADVIINPYISETITKIDNQTLKDEYENKYGVVNFFNPINITKYDGLNKYANKFLTDALGLTETYDGNKMTDNYYHIFENLRNSRDGNATIYISSAKTTISDNIINTFEKYHQYFYKYDLTGKTQEERVIIANTTPYDYRSCVVTDENGLILGIYLIHKIATHANNEQLINESRKQHDEQIKRIVANGPFGQKNYNNTEFDLYRYQKLKKDFENTNKTKIIRKLDIRNMTQNQIRAFLNNLPLNDGETFTSLYDDMGYILDAYIIHK